MNTEPSTITTDAVALIDNARTIGVITTDDEYLRAADYLRGIKAFRQKIADTFDEHIARAYQAHRALVQEKRTAEAAAVECEAIVKQLIVDYERKRARALADERARLDVQLRVERAEREAVAVQAEAAGDFVRADTLRAVNDVLAAPLTAPTPKPDGVVIREVWSARVVNFAALVHAAAAHAPYLALLKPDTRALDQQARSLKSRLQIPGVEAVVAKTVGARS